jgi:glycolate oxidase iron-sulfur subunit
MLRWRDRVQSACGAEAPLQTSFTPEQLGQPEIAEADGILRTCVHYGFCTAACPTYVLTRDENDSPRGRIDLIRAMLEKGGAPDARTVHHLDRCLSCLSCVTTCAVKVDYTHLIDIARAHIERHFRRPLGDRLLRALLARTLPYPSRFAAALRAGKLARPLAGLMPRRLRNLAQMAGRSVRPGLLAPQTFRPAAGEPTRRRVLLLAGCAQQALDAEINAATIRVLTRHGCEVVIAEGAGCCGALPLHMGREVEARALAQRNVAAWCAELARGADAVVVNASGCGTTVKDYGFMLRTDPAYADKATQVSRRAMDISEYLEQLKLAPERSTMGLRVAYHAACSLQHGQKITRAPKDLLSKIGFVVKDVPEGHLCCGSAGTYNMLEPELAKRLQERKVGNIEKLKPDVIAAGNIGCMTQIAAGTAIPVVHTVELIDWATGGPAPAALAGTGARAPSGETVAARM